MNRGFTFLEMTVVIAVIAIVTHLAVREIGHYREEKLSEAADRQLADIREAAHRFLCDVGRLPKLVAATNSEGETVWTLSELWKRPAGLVECRRVEKDGVHLAVGWKGPYLKLPFGRDRLLDPWGNPMEFEDGAGLQRLWTDAQGSVTNVCHYGPAAQPFQRRDISLVPCGGTEAELIVTVDAGSYSGPLECSWYGPHENSLTNATATLAEAGGQMVFKGVPCGRKAIKVTSDRSVVRLVEVTAPVTQIEIKVQ